MDTADSRMCCHPVHECLAIEKDWITDVPGMPRDPFGWPTACCDPPDVQLIREGSLDEVNESSIGRPKRK